MAIAPETRTALAPRRLLGPVAGLLLCVLAGCAAIRPAPLDAPAASRTAGPAEEQTSEATPRVAGDTPPLKADEETREPDGAPEARDPVRQVAAIDRIEVAPEPPGSEQALAPTPGPVIPDDPLDRPPASPAEAAMRDAGDLISRGQPENARMILLIAARRRPVDPALCIALARINESLKNWKEAADWYAAADDQPRASNAPGMLPQWERQRARCLYRHGDCTTACALWAASIAVKDRTVSLAELVEYADACLQVDDRETAQLLLDQASSRTSGRIRELELLRATCAMRRGDTAAAQAVATAALDEWPHEERFVRLVNLVTSEEESGAPEGTMSDESPEEVGTEATPSLPRNETPSVDDFAADSEESEPMDRPMTPYGRQ